MANRGFSAPFGRGGGSGFRGRGGRGRGGRPTFGGQGGGQSTRGSFGSRSNQRGGNHQRGGAPPTQNYRRQLERVIAERDEERTMRQQLERERADIDNYVRKLEADLEEQQRKLSDALLRNSQLEAQRRDLEVRLEDASLFIDLHAANAAWREDEERPAATAVDEGVNGDMDPYGMDWSDGSFHDDA